MIDLLYLPSLVLLGGLVVGGVRATKAGNPVLGGNALVSAGATAGPLCLEWLLAPVLGVSLDLGPILPLWVAVAGVLHTIGMTTVYERVWWWDHLTHTVSAGLIGALIYGTLIAVDGAPGAPSLSGTEIAAVTVGMTLLAGICWELIEVVGRDIAVALGREPMLVPYGRRDTALDLVFDIVGPVLIVLLDVRVFVAIAEGTPETATAVLWWAGGLLAVVSVLLAGGLAITHRWWER